MKTRKYITLAIILLIVAFVAGCSSDANKGPAKEKYPTKPVSVIVPNAAGGPTDIGARMLMPFVEKELGGNMPIINKAGGGGWLGWTDLLNAKPDGYNLAAINTPHVMSYLDPEIKRSTTNLDSFELLCNHVTDYGIVAIRPNDTRFKNIKELIEYARTNELTTTAGAKGSDDHVAMLKWNKAANTKFVPVFNTKGVAEFQAAFLGGHIDVYFGNIGDSLVHFKNGEMKIIAVMAPERSKFLPDIPTTKELGFEVYSWSSRGFVAPKGMDKELKDKIVAAFEKAINNPEHIKKMAEIGLAVNFKKGDDYKNFLLQEEQGIKGVMDMLGWKK